MGNNKIDEETDQVFMNVFDHHFYIVTDKVTTVDLFSIEDHTGHLDMTVTKRAFNKKFVEAKEV